VLEILGSALMEGIPGTVQPDIDNTAESPPRRLRILVVGPVPPPYGGIASVLEDIVRSELSSDYSFDVFPRTAIFPPHARGWLGRNLFRLRRFLRFYRQASRGAYHLLHIHSADPAFPGTVIFMALARLAGLRVLLHMHGTDWNDFYGDVSPGRRLFIRAGLRLAHCIVVLYALWADEIRKLLPTAKVQVMGNLVRRQAAPDASVVRDTRKQLGLEKAHFIVLSIGSVGWRKGSFEILKAAPLVLSRDDSVRFVLVGGEEFPGDMARLRSVVAEEALDGPVKLLGETERDRVPAFMSLAHVFLLPSFVEGMPITIIEAMQWGVPVIATRVAAIPDMIEDRVSGLLISPGAPHEIAEAVLLLKRDGSLRQRLASAGQKAFEERFEFSRGIEHVRELYESL
jgi:glycosyltransferase involved in cell wall biosynthesis